MADFICFEDPFTVLLPGSSNGILSYPDGSTVSFNAISVDPYFDAKLSVGGSIRSTNHYTFDYATGTTVVFAFSVPKTFGGRYAIFTLVHFGGSISHDPVYSDTEWAGEFIAYRGNVDNNTKINKLTVNSGSNVNIVFNPDAAPYMGYEVDDVLVDGESQGNLLDYGFYNITQNHTIEVFFKVKAPTVYVNVSSGLGGTAVCGNLDGFNFHDPVFITVNPSVDKEVDSLRINWVRYRFPKEGGICTVNDVVDNVDFLAIFRNSYYPAIDCIPNIFYSDVVPSPFVVSASSFYAEEGGDSQEPYKGINFIAQEGLGWVAGGVVPQWWQIKLDSIKAIQQYSFASSMGTKPNSWTLEGSLNGADWTVLDTKEGITTWGWVEETKFVIASPGYFQYYRINFTAVNGEDNGVTIRDFRLLTVPNGYIRSSESVVPKMESEILPSPVVITTSSEYNAGDYGAWNLFSGRIDGWDGLSTDWSSEDGVIAAWVQVYSGGDLWYVSGYVVNSGLDWGDPSPKAWSLYGSINGTTWDLLDTQIDQIDWGYQESRTYAIAVPGSYSYYKFDVSDNNGGSYTEFGKLELLGYLDNQGTIVATCSAFEVDLRNFKDGDVFADLLSVPARSTIHLAASDDSSGRLVVLAETAVIVFSSAEVNIGSLSCSAENLGVFITDQVFSLGGFLVEGENARFSSAGIVGINGRLLVPTGLSLLTVSGLTDSIGRLGVTCGSLQVLSSGVTDVVGELLGTVSNCLVILTSLVDSTGKLVMTSGYSQAQFLGLAQGIGGILSVTKIPQFVSSGVLEGTGSLLLTAQFLRCRLSDDVSVVTSGRSFCINLIKKGVVTKFTNFGFNSYAVINKVIVGGNGSGLFKLLGNTDNSEVIYGKVVFPLSDFGVGNAKQLRAIKVFGRSNAAVNVSVGDDKGVAWETSITLGDVNSYSADGGIGYFPFSAKSKYFQVMLTNSNGSMFFLDQITLFMYILGVH